MAYINTVVTHFHLEDVFKVKTLMDTNVHLTKLSAPNTKEEQECMSKLPYLALIGSLMYASMSMRPDITHAVSNLGKYSSNPSRPIGLLCNRSSDTSMACATLGSY